MPDILPPVRRSPLQHRAALEGAGGAVGMLERRLLGKFVIRADPHQAVERLRAALGLGLPFDPSTSSTSPNASFLWLGPDEWMLVTDDADAATAAATARGALAGIHHQITDVSDYYTVIEVAGERARELIMKLTTVDLHPRAVRPGCVTGCVLGRANAMLWHLADGYEPSRPIFRLFVRWSMADYLWCLLAEAGREWGVPEQAVVKGERLTVA